MDHYKIVIGKAAIDDIQSIAYWYNGQQNGLSDRFNTSLQTCLDEVLKTPDRFALHKGSKLIRKAKLKVFPYYIFYLILQNNIEIVGVIHTARSDKYICNHLK